MKENHYQKATDEIIDAIKELGIRMETPFNKVSFRKGRRLIIKMLKTNFIPKKTKWG